MPASETFVEWKCYRCREGGRMAQLHVTTLKHIQDGVERGHDRRAARCHAAYGLVHVRAIINGKTMRFPLIQSEGPEIVAPGSAETEDLARPSSPALND
jgi:hypothetical protein